MMRRLYPVIISILLIGIIAFTLMYDAPTAFIIEEIRLPRLAMLMVIAMMLALAGLILQTVTKNDLADPSILGINQGSGLAIALLLIATTTTSLTTTPLVPLVAIIGGVMAAIVLLLLSVRHKKLNLRGFILNGIGLNALLASVIVLMMSRTKDALKIDFMMKWLMGNLWSFDWSQVAMLWIVFVGVMIVLYMMQKEWRLLALEEEQQQLLGMPYQCIRLCLMFLAVLLTSLSVAYAGGLTFIGLLAPHIARQLSGHSVKRQFILTLLVAMVLMLACDMITQLLLASWGLSQGSLLALLGAPYFIYQLFKSSAIND